ncbi:MAG: TonB family protein [Cyclobacteriaceae bacterium]|jgi:TonB family protein|nr:TonB family protein [Cyclobacteriaceae bacterium]
MDKYQHDIDQYINGKMTNAERHAFEKKMLNDPFLADAVEGAQQAESFSSDVHDLINAIDEQKNNKTRIAWWRMAAALVLLATSAYFVWNYLQEDKKEIETIAQAEPKKEIEQKQDSLQPIEKDLIAQNKTEAIKKGKPVLKEDENSEEKINPKDLAIATETQVVTIADEQEEIKTEKIKTEDEKKAVAAAAPIIEAKPTIRAEEINNAIKDELSKEGKARRSNFNSNTTKVSGKVTSAEDGSFIPGINVVEKGTTNATISKEDGSYELMLTTDNPVLVFSFIGMRTLEIPVGEREIIDAELGLDVTQLSEVVVTGYGGNKEETTSYEQARPIIGWSAYQQYLNDHVVYPSEAKEQNKEGRVIITFQVDVNGNLSDFEFVRKAGFGMDEALLKAIKEGPVWQSAKSNGLSIKEKATVRYRFRLK